MFRTVYIYFSGCRRTDPESPIPEDQGDDLPDNLEEIHVFDEYVFNLL